MKLVEVYKESRTLLSISTTQPWGRLIPWERLEETIKVYAAEEELPLEETGWKETGDAYKALNLTPQPISIFVQNLKTVGQLFRGNPIIICAADFAGQQAILWLQSQRKYPLEKSCLQILANLTRHITLGSIEYSAFEKDICLNWALDRKEGTQFWLQKKKGEWTTVTTNGTVGKVKNPQLSLLSIEEIIPAEIRVWKDGIMPPSKTATEPTPELVKAFKNSLLPL